MNQRLQPRARPRFRLTSMQAMGGAAGTRLAGHVLWDSRLVVRVNNQTAPDVKGMLKSPKGKRLSIEEMGP